MTRTTATHWYEITSRSEVALGATARLGSTDSLLDEQRAARARAWDRLSVLREIWMPLVPSTVGFPGWREDPQEPVLRELVVEFEQQAPEVWAQAETQLLTDAEYARARERLREIQELLDRAHGFELAARGDGDIPADQQLLYLGKAAPGPYVELLPGLTSVAVVTDEFTAALQREGLTAGWSTMAVPVVDRVGTPLTDHRLLVVTGRVTESPARFDALPSVGRLSLSPARSTARTAPASARMQVRRQRTPWASCG